MPFAPKISKDILAALDEHILPALRTQRVTQLLAEPPFDFNGVGYQVIQQKLLQEKTFAPLQTIVQWKEQSVMATNFPRFMFVFEGVCKERIGMTPKLAQPLSAAERDMYGGIAEVTLHAPAVICHPAFTVHSSGAPQPKPYVHRGCAIYCKVVQSGIRLSLNVRSPAEAYATHNLEINDPDLAHMARLYIAELRADSHESAQALQLAFMLRMHRYLSQHRALISNSCWVTPPDILPDAAKVLSAANVQLCQHLTEHIINHLHSPLSLNALAKRFHVSGVHLNSVFKQAHGTTVMNFVTQMRLEAAKTILAAGQERISDIAQLVGFASNASFTNSFRRATGLSPKEYRKRMDG